MLGLCHIKRNNVCFNLKFLITCILYFYVGNKTHDIFNLFKILIYDSVKLIQLIVVQRHQIHKFEFEPARLIKYLLKLIFINIILICGIVCE